MNIFEKLLPINLYHSYIVEGDGDTTAKELLSFLKSRGDVANDSSDILFQSYESFTMDDSSEIKSWHNQLGATGEKRICIITTKFINREAEQTLLKIIEEPTLNTHFFIVVPDSSVLLPTIISRTHIIKIEKEDDKNIEKEAIAFILSKPKERIDKVALIIKNNKDEENSGQLRYYATSFVNELEKNIYQKFKKDRSNKDVIFILEELQKSRDYLSTPGASVKMILEHLAIVI